MSIEEMRHEQQLVDYKIKDITNDLGYKRFRGEKIDEEYERDSYNEEQYSAARRRMLSITFDDDDEYSIQTQEYLKRFSSTITPVLPIEEPDNSISMGDEHLDTTLSIENLVPIPSEFEGISDDTSDVPNCDNNCINVESSLINHDTSIKFDPILEEFAGELAHIAPIPPGIVEADFDPNDDTSSDDDSFENIEYVDATPSYSELDSLEEEIKDQEEKEFNLEDIFQIQDVILREKLLNVHRLISNIESLKVNPTPDRVLKSPYPFHIPVADSDSFLEETDTSFSLPEFKTSSDYTEETRSGSTTTHANYSLPEYDSFLFEIEPDQEVLISIDNSNNFLLELPEFESFHFDPSFPRLPPEPPDVRLDFKPDTVMRNNEDFNQREIVLSLNVEDVNTFTFVIWTFLPFFTYPEDSPVILSFRNEDLVFDPGISTFHFSFKPVPFALPKDK
ncbi:hypothetical protein Tco_0923394 [Tanacetum coccineum]|uniref:Uncharacterized protein n=1 Tax=Tanacetum coccineum TaxID=301880 RepID=A0ABQ5D0U6_9ASTR